VNSPHVTCHIRALTVQTNHVCSDVVTGPASPFLISMRYNIRDAVVVGTQSPRSLVQVSGRNGFMDWPCLLHGWVADVCSWV